MSKKVNVWLLVFAMLAGIILSPAMFPNVAHAADGFYVSNGVLKDANGNSFMIRGVNNPHIWHDTNSFSALDSIAANGANSVRIVWDMNGSATRLNEIINRCKELKLIAIPEIHDFTGNDDVQKLKDAANYWARSDIKPILTNNRKYVLVNIANEWGSWQLSDETWRDAYKQAIDIIRNAGIYNTIVIDGSSWAQNASPIKNYGQTLLDYDSSHNLLFDIHMYGEWNDSSKVTNEIHNLVNASIPFIIGEFGYNYDNGNNNLNCTVDAQRVMDECQEHGIGYMPWSWCGNNSENAWLDMTSNWGSLTSWGNWVINGTNGIKSTSQLCSVFGGSTPTPTPTSTPGVTVKYDFENSTNGWSGDNVAGGPWSVTEWKVNGSYSLKADIDMAGGRQHSLRITSNDNFSGKSYLKARVRHASWGTLGSGMSAKVYVKTGSGWSWYDSGAVSIGSGSSGTTLTLNLSNVSNKDQIKEVGVQFIDGSNSSGRTAIYVDYVTLE